MKRTKRTVITEESHEIWIIRHPDDHAYGEPHDGSAPPDDSVVDLLDLPRDRALVISDEAQGDHPTSTEQPLDSEIDI